MAFLTTLVFCGALLNTALAGPPARQVVGHGPISNPAPTLDLRPPAVAFEPSGDEAAAFPSVSHRQWLSSAQEQRAPVAESGAHEQSRLPGFRAETSTGRNPGGVEGFARRVRREGLPIARLWENKSSLVSLGLNQRGKPGLWFVQKIR